jgi:hypothetical protein
MFYATCDPKNRIDKYINAQVGLYNYWFLVRKAECITTLLYYTRSFTTQGALLGFPRPERVALRRECACPF